MVDKVQMQIFLLLPGLRNLIDMADFWSRGALSELNLVNLERHTALHLIRRADYLSQTEAMCEFKYLNKTVRLLMSGINLGD